MDRIKNVVDESPLKAFEEELSPPGISHVRGIDSFGRTKAITIVIPPIIIIMIQLSFSLLSIALYELTAKTPVLTHLKVKGEFFCSKP